MPGLPLELTADAGLGGTSVFRYARGMRDAPDERLMLKYAGGDAEAFEVLYDRYRVPLYRYFMRQVADPSKANDLYQGCWEKVIKNRGRYSSDAPFRAWLFRIAHNHLVDSYRAQKPETDLDDEAIDPSSSDTGDILDQDQKNRKLQLALEALPPDQRDAMSLKLHGGLNLEEIAAVTGVGMETAKSRLRYATRKLKEVLQS